MIIYYDLNENFGMLSLEDNNQQVYKIYRVYDAELIHYKKIAIIKGLNEIPKKPLSPCLDRISWFDIQELCYELRNMPNIFMGGTKKVCLNEEVYNCRCVDYIWNEKKYITFMSDELLPYRFNMTRIQDIDDFSSTLCCNFLNAKVLPNIKKDLSQLISKSPYNYEWKDDVEMRKEEIKLFIPTAYNLIGDAINEIDTLSPKEKNTIKAFQRQWEYYKGVGIQHNSFIKKSNITPNTCWWLDTFKTGAMPNETCMIVDGNGKVGGRRDIYSNINAPLCFSIELTKNMLNI